ncbi:hypothetical protein [uncultured Sanguibacteroides sp.]|uniref:hypothetical protein n=1 Tax=uncultured Sanguibacteroides sp. TaxID=1635151 RepID=UPI0025DD0EA2|nr:hypothetical protein [uncultured Sanguibacteroides sp.]
MKLYEAIARMRKQTAQGRAFSFSFMSYNSSTNTTEGVVFVHKAVLRKKADAKSYRNADVLIPYYDYDICKARQFYLPCLLNFNGEKITMR